MTIMDLAHTRTLMVNYTCEKNVSKLLECRMLTFFLFFWCLIVGLLIGLLVGLLIGSLLCSGVSDSNWSWYV